MNPRIFAASLFASAAVLSCGAETGTGARPQAESSARPSQRPSPAPTSADSSPTVAEAVAFVEDVEQHLRRLWVARDEASWVNENFITDDTEALAAAGE